VAIRAALRAVGREATTFDDRLEEVTYSYHDYRRIILGTDIPGWTLNIAGHDDWHGQLFGTVLDPRELHTFGSYPVSRDH
jgi:hypothetical protein